MPDWVETEEPFNPVGEPLKIQQETKIKCDLVKHAKIENPPVKAF